MFADAKAIEISHNVAVIFSVTCFKTALDFPSLWNVLAQ